MNNFMLIYLKKLRENGYFKERYNLLKLTTVGIKKM